MAIFSAAGLYVTATSIRPALRLLMLYVVSLWYHAMRKGLDPLLTLSSMKASARAVAPM